MHATKSYFLADMSVMFGRSMRHVFRSLDTIMTVCLSPMAIMLLFVYVFGGAIQIDTTVPYINYLIPGIMLMTIANGIGYVSYRLFLDQQRGIFERFHTMPIARSAPLLVSNTLSVGVIIVVALVMGFRPAAGIVGWLAVGGILGMFTLALTWIAVIAGLSAKSLDSAGAFAFAIHLLPFVSSAFVPTASMPRPVRFFADYQPVTPIVESIRALLLGQSLGNTGWVALAWCVGIMLVAYGFAMRVYKRK
ncbi:ABC transporter permease [Herpetosiphon llansteffanensis]|uniref:ABC transporter permease n=1 Tax=Herpetosiphon llansteffanensis TaxID=2094568 RepID=UPI000D7C1DFA|nr:ABC transporter permease [Herpetosiphon llansteffanensis]